MAFAFTALIGAWTAYDRSAAWGRSILLSAGLLVALGIAWRGRREGETLLGPVALGGAGLAAAVGGYYLLGAAWQAGSGAKLPALQQIGVWVQTHRPAGALPQDIHPNVAGGLLAILLPLGAGGCAWAWQRGRRWLEGWQF